MLPDLLNIWLCWSELKSVARKRGCPPSHLYRNKDVGTAAAGVGFLWLIVMCIQWMKSFFMPSCNESCFLLIPRFRLSSAPAVRYSFLASLVSLFNFWVGLLFFSASPVVALLWIPYFWRIASRNFSRSSSVFSCFACRSFRYACNVFSLSIKNRMVVKCMSNKVNKNLHTFFLAPISVSFLLQGWAYWPEKRAYQIWFQPIISFVTTYLSLADEVVSHFPYFVAHQTYEIVHRQRMQMKLI